MKYRLPGPGANVEHGTVSVLDVALASDLGSGKMAASNDLGVLSFGIFQSREMFLGNDEHVGRRFRADVFKGEDVLVFVNLPGGNLPADDAAENTIACGFAHDCSLRFA